MAEISSFFAHPLLLLATGGLLTGIFAPKITTRWQDNKKKREIKVNLVVRSGEIIGIAMGHASYNLLKEEVTKNEVFDLFLQEWFTKSYTFYVESLAFYGQGLASKWQDFFSVLEYYIIVSKFFLCGDATPKYSGKLMSALQKAKIEYINVNWQIIHGSDLDKARLELKRLSPFLYAFGKALQEEMLKSDITITSKN